MKAPRVPAVMLALAALAAPAVHADDFDWRRVPRPSLRTFDPPKPRRVVLPNGMVMFLQEDRELPLVYSSLLVRGGSRDEPADKTGLISIYGSTWRTGGTTSRTGDDLDDLLAARAASLETSGGSSWTSLSWSCLKEDVDTVFEAAVELLRQPAFREDKIALAKRQMESGIARRNDTPGSILSREAQKLVYGPGSPLSRTPEYATVRAVTRDDLLAWHGRVVHPNNIIVGVVGDFDSKAMEERLRKAFATWPKGAAAPETPIEASGPKPGVYLVTKEDVNQTNVAFLDIGIRRDNPDYYAVEMMNAVWSGFAGRLFSRIRTEKGLAYSVGGGISALYTAPGRFTIRVATKSESTATVIDALKHEEDLLLKEPPTADEMSRAMDTLLNSFVFTIDSPDKILMERMTYEFFGYPLDLLERYRDNIQKVTAADVLAVARKYVKPERQAILVVGNPKDFDRPLSTFGPVAEIDVRIPPPPDAPKPGAGQP